MGIFFTSQIRSIWKAFLTYVGNQFSTSLKILQSESKEEYMSLRFQTFLQQNGNISQRLCQYICQQNGITEGKNIHLLVTVCSLIFESFVATHYWPEEWSTTVHLINRLPSLCYWINLHILYSKTHHQHIPICVLLVCMFCASSSHWTCKVNCSIGVVCVSWICFPPKGFSLLQS